MIKDVSPPHDLSVEAIVLGGCLLEDDTREDILPHLFRGLFYDTKHELISNSIQKLNEARKTIDTITVTDDLRRGGVLEDAGGAYYITSVTNRLASSANTLSHILILKELYIRRQLLTISRTISMQANDTSDDILEAVTSLKNSLDGIDKVIVKHQRVKDLENIVDESVSQLQQRCKNYDLGVISGIPSWPQLDSFTGGWQKKELIVIAARPGMGKTAVVLDFAERAAMAGIAPVIFSLEMADTRLMDRMIIGKSEIPASKYRNGELNPHEWSNILHASEALKKLPITIYDNPGMTFRDMRSLSRLKKKEGKCGMIIIDYLQLALPDTTNHGRNREQEVSEMSRKAKLMAKELDVPVILLAQLSRETEKAGDKRPKLSHLRESGSIEQDADMVIFINRPDYYGMTDASGGDLKGIGELIIAKHRNGSIVDVPFRHNESLTKFFPFQNSF